MLLTGDRTFIVLSNSFLAFEGNNVLDGDTNFDMFQELQLFFKGDGYGLS